MKFIPENVYHVFNQGNNNQVVFSQELHFYYFLNLYKEFVGSFCETLSWCLVHTHFHFMIYTDERCLDVKKQGGLFLNPVTNGFRKLLSSYAHEYNNKNNRTGSLFRPKTKSVCLNDKAAAGEKYQLQQDYYLNTFNYIHNNPVEAGIVKNTIDWKWSSFPSNSGQRTNSICNISLAKQICGIS